MTSAIEEIFCWNLQVPEFWDFEISCWHKEVLRGNDYISNFWAHIYVILTHWFHNENMLNLSNQWANENWLLRSCECLLKKSNQSDRFPSRRESSLIGQSDCFPPRGENDPIGWESCFVFKTVVPKHRFCKLQNVWNVCEFGSDYKWYMIKI